MSFPIILSLSCLFIDLVRFLMDAHIGVAIFPSVFFRCLQLVLLFRSVSYWSIFLLSRSALNWNGELRESSPASAHPC